MRDDHERLQDILEAIENIERYVDKGKANFEQNELVQVWIIHNIQIIGEAAGKIGDSLQEANPQVPWHQITAMRNILVHEYFGADLDEIWIAAERDLPVLKHQILNILNPPEQ